MSRNAIKVDVYVNSTKFSSDRRGRMSEPNTKNKILDSAEYLFAKKGLKETSVRDITAYADVHLAAVNYHFKTKEGLVKSLIEERIGPLIRKSMELLDRYENRFGEGSVPVEYALYALLSPGIKLCFESPDFLKILGQIVSHPDEEMYSIFRYNFEKVLVRFRQSIISSLPDISQDNLTCRVHFITGAMIHTWINHSGLNLPSSAESNLRPEDQIINELISFCSAGLRAEILDIELEQHEQDWEN